MKLAASIKSMAKMALQSRKASLRPLRPAPSRPMLIMGNGPSLRTTLTRDARLLAQADLMAVNFAANTDECIALQPHYYIMADPHFFAAAGSDPNVDKLWQRLDTLVAWPMTLLVPMKENRRKLTTNPLVTVKGFNPVGVEGYDWLAHMAFSAGLGMPRPRNVLIPAIMCALRLGYRRILIAGADHSWSKTLDVRDDNTVVSIQPHFYADNDAESARVSQVYSGIRLHQLYESFAIAFRSYHQIAKYASTVEAQIFNVTPGSFIDAFPRIDLSKTEHL